ncbi:TonB-dependent receptor [Sinomicrobium soli]|uniref:TonB-dependent receptor n=1 Tax=Sinomicrobium sp. N-1-3-6 TaxID=2219864 RepID=UPI000DCDDD07|nr:TonB-dependent receptor [Sinomicrobium sp. N-1-3-6]RAV30009.1 TonB-dependent receptor [Sinomicrobium sp. N-1-3-6]
MTRKVFSTIIFIVIAGCLSPLCAQHKISGIVKSDDGKLLRSVQVQIEKTSLTTLTDENGYFEFPDINGEKAALVFDHTAYHIDREEVNLPAIGLVIVLSPRENALELEEVVIDGYIKKNTSTSNKMPLNFIENPQAFSSIDQSVLEDQVLFTVDDAYRNVTGLQKKWNATNRAGDGGSYVVLRGFLANNSLRNGLVAPVTTAIDAINIEKVEVLKGPSATLFGSNVTSYGGVINRITKKPFETFAGNVTVAAGGYNYYRARADVNTPVTKDNKLMFRINTAYTNSGNFQKKDAKNEHFAFTPSLLYKPNDRLDIQVDFEMFDTKAIPEQILFSPASVPALGIADMNDLEDILGLDYKQSYIGDGLKTRAKVRNLSGQVNYKINNHIRSSTNISTSYTFSDGPNPAFYIVPKGTFTQDPADTEIGLLRFDQSTVNSKKTYFQVQQNFNLDYNFGNVRNRTVAGFDYMRTKDDQKFISTYFDWVPFSGADYSGFNGKAVQAIYDNTPNPATYLSTGNLNTYSGYISNVLTPVEGLNIMAGIRYESNDFGGGYTMTSNSISPAYSQSAWSPKLGVVYEIFRNKFSVFGNYQNSFKSNGYYIADTDGNALLSDPEKGNQWEGGLKMNVLQNRINATLSYYNIKVKNSLLLTGELTSSMQYVQAQAGELTSEGVELEVNAYLVKGFSLIGGISYNDAEVTENKVNPALVGTRPVDAGSKWLANFNVNYRFLDGNIKGLGFGLGGNYASDNNVTGDFILPEYFILNANAFYDTKRFRIGVRYDNITNKHYWIGYQTANPQALANVVGSLAFKF